MQLGGGKDEHENDERGKEFDHNNQYADAAANDRRRRP